MSLPGRDSSNSGQGRRPLPEAIGLIVQTIASNPVPFSVTCAAVVLLGILSELHYRSTASWSRLTSLDYAFRLGVLPCIMAGMAGAMCYTALGRKPAPIPAVARLALRSYLRFVVVDLIFLGLLYASVFAASVVSHLASRATDTRLVAASAVVPLAFLRFCWLPALVLNNRRGMLRSLARGVVSTVRSPLVLFCVIAGSAWAGINTLADIFFRMPFPVVVARSIIYCLVDCTALAAAALGCLDARTAIFHEKPMASPDMLLPKASEKESASRTTTALAFLSVFPILNVAAAVVGWRHMKTSGRFTVSGIAAFCSGVLSIVVYAVVLLGLLLPRSDASISANYDAILSADASLTPQIDLLRQNNGAEAENQLSAIIRSRPYPGWPACGALAIAQADQGKTKQALASFRAAFQQGEAPAVLFVACGRMLMRSEDYAGASAVFSEALKRDPLSGDARRFDELADNVFQPSKMIMGVWFFIILLFLFTFHEYAHAYTAWRLGDDTAMRAGRVTLNPIPHLDLFGSLLLPGILLFRGSDMVFGWAKPVPVNSALLKDPRRDHRSVSFAGPGMNLLMAATAVTLMLTALFLIRAASPEALTLNVIMPGEPVSVAGIPGAGVLTIAFSFLKVFVYSSLTIALFNLIPFPPLDGSWILSSLLGPRAMAFHAGLQKYSFVFILILAFTPVVNYILVIPILPILGVLQLAASALGFA